MAKWHGKIGYVVTEEVEPGIYKEKITERYYYGDLIRNSRRLESSTTVNDNINISNEISIVADPFADLNLYAMRYIEFKGARWKVNNVSVQPPRLILTIGGLYNGPTSKTT